MVLEEILAANLHRLVMLCVFASIMASAESSFAQDPCPGKPNAHVIARIEKTEPDGTIRRTTRCQCNEGYEPAGDGSCMRATTRPECVRFAGEALHKDLQACQGPIMSCLRTEGVPADVATCTTGTLAAGIPFTVSAAADPTKATTILLGVALANALSSCQANARSIATACSPAAGICEEKALNTHRAAVTACPSR